MDQAAVSGAIVAGGQSARFGGEPKGLFPVGGVPILHRVAAALRAVVPDIVLIANDPQADRWLPGIAVQHDERAERGSLVGLHTAISRARGSVLVVAWDMPFVTSELLGLVLAAAADDAYAVVPEGPDALEPMCALYAARCLPFVGRALDQGELRLGSLLAQLPTVVRVPRDRVAAVGDPARLFFNVNTPADLARAERLASAP